MWLEKMRQSFPSFYSTCYVNKERLVKSPGKPVKLGRCGDPEGGTLVLTAVQSSDLSSPLKRPALNCDAPAELLSCVGEGVAVFHLSPESHFAILLISDPCQLLKPMAA